MAQGKTEFIITVSDVNSAVQLINHFLQTNNYRQMNSNGVIWYQFNDPMVIGKAGLEYYVNGNQITILAYLKTFDNPIKLDNDLVGALGKQAYMNKLNPLLNQLRVNNESNYKGGYAQNNYNDAYGQSNYNGGYTQNNYNNGYTQGNMINNMEIEVKQSKNKFSVLALVMSVLSLIMSCFGGLFGVFVQIVIYYFAYIGLKSEKRGMAISAIVINSVALMITFIMLIVGTLLG